MTGIGLAERPRSGYGRGVAAPRERESQLSRLARRGFADPATAAALLAGPEFADLAVDPLFLESVGHCADPDTALGSLARLLAADTADLAVLQATLAASQPLRRRLSACWGSPRCSATSSPGTPSPGTRSTNWSRRISRRSRSTCAARCWPRWTRIRRRPEPRAALTGLEAADALRVAYRRGLLRITARDVAGNASMPEVGSALSDLAGATLEAALAVARAELPADAAPCRLAVVGMGKCGARELNYVSDVDVVFVAAPGRMADGQRGGGVRGPAHRAPSWRPG